jgi:hypothetical protein
VATAPSGTIEPAAFNNATAVRDGLIKRGMDPDTATGAAANALHESVANPRTGRGDNGNAAGLFMWTGPRLQAYIDKTGHPPDGAPLDEQLDFLMSEWNGSESAAAAKIAAAQGPAAKAAAFSQYFLRPKDTQGEMQRRSATALQLQQQIGGGTTTASAAPPTAQPGQPVPTQVAGPPMVSTAPPGTTAAPGGPPAAASPATTQPVATQATSQANLPHASAVPTGASAPQYQQAMDLQRRAMLLDAQPDPTGRLKTLAAGLRSQAALILQTDSVVNTQEGQLHTMTGKLDDPAKPLADYRETSPGSGIWVGGPGTEPRFQPPGRLVVGPDGTVWQTSTSGAHVLQPADPAAIAARKAAESLGSGTGTDVAKQLPAMITQARNAAQQEGQIDYASNQLREAAKGGIPTGYFSDALATAAAGAKSLGIDTSSLGVNPEAVGNMQTAQKTLSVIGGAIIRQALGPGSAITDGKIEQFIHTQPGIQNDPQALQRIMAWARSQYTYEREMGQAAVAEAAKSPTGTLPLNWQAQYYRDHGFAPIYDPVTQEMQQPDGRQPTRETPSAASTQQTTSPAVTLPPKALSSLTEGHVTTFSNGQQWTLRNGQPVQVKK